jgi:ketosteroid isomerase-like protein
MSTSTSPSPTPVEIVQSLYAAFGRSDVPAILAALRDDVDWHVNVDLAAPGAAQVPTFRPCRGPRAVGEFFVALGQTVDLHSFQPVSFLGGTREAAARILMEFTVRSTGQRRAVESMHYFSFDAQGKVARFVDFLDTLGETHAMGLIKSV